MRKVFELPSLCFVVIVLTTIINSGCTLSVLEQNEKTNSTTKPLETIFTVVDTTDVKKPIVVNSIRLPFRSGLKNNVVLAKNYAYVTTETQLLVIDVSNPQKPVNVTSLSFPESIGKAHVADDKLVVASKNRLYLVDISNPVQPKLKSNASLHQSNAVGEFDIHNSYLYVKDVNDYLHIYQLTQESVLPIKTVEMESPSDLVGIIAQGTEVEQIVLKHRTSSDYGWTELSDRTNLLDFNCVHQMIRTTTDHLVFASRRYPCRDITIVNDESQRSPYIWKWLEDYNLEANYIAHLYLTGKRKLHEGIPTDAFYKDRNKIQLVSQDQWSHTIEYEADQEFGLYTDLQIDDKYLYVVTSKGILSIIDLDAPERKDRFQSAISLDSIHPVSVAVGQNHAFVISTPEDASE